MSDGENNVPSIELALRRKRLKTQPSTIHTRKQQAICVRRAYKKYGPKSSPHVVLDALNMTVPKGTIYGLLGASGCGKTTLLSCVVGRRRLNSGEIWVLGGKPGSRGSGVPGPRIGYMPQELALYGEFTIRETMIYFGWIAGMKAEDVDDRLHFLLNLLLLPSGDRTVKTLSGGQQRRVSFAAALLHEPELLILDEPTVGLDPVLRQSIWDHLVHIVKERRVTVIITTHYIEETRQADIIGLMRGGYFLAEESPTQLMHHYGAETLEDVFLKLSVIQNMGKRRRSSILQVVTDTIDVPSGVVNEAAVVDDEFCEISGEFGDNVSMSSRGGRISIAPEDLPPPELPPDDDIPVHCTDYLKIFQYNHMKALIWKNFMWMWRNFGVMCFIFVLPIVQTVLFCWSIGHDATGLKLAVANYEVNTSIDMCSVVPGCNATHLSCRYLKQLENRQMKLCNYNSAAAAKEAVKEGNAWAAIVFPANYSEALQERINMGKDTDPWDAEYANVDVWQDKSNQQIAAFLWRDLNYAFQDFLQDYLKSCDYSPLVASVPIKWNRPVYGVKTPNFTDFAAPGVILTIIFFLSVALTSGAMLIERNQGILERSLVSGISGVEILLSHVITQFVVMVGQTVLILVFSFAVFDITNNGNFAWVIIITLLTGFCGMCFGFVVSCCCDTERTATYMALGSFLPMVMLCGIIWPIEGMDKILRFIAYFLPLTKSTESLRSILQRGWGMSMETVYVGFVSTLLWIIIFLTVSLLVLKFKKG